MTKFIRVMKIKQYMKMYIYQCHQCFMVEPQNDDLKEYNEYMIEKNRLSRLFTYLDGRT